MSYRNKRKLRNSRRFSEMGKQSQRVQAERRAIDEPERIRELAEIEIANLPSIEGDALGSLQWTDFRTGKVRRWTVCIGDRADRVTLHAPDGRKTESHGGTWVMNHLRSWIFGQKRHASK